ncbi:hypothetical protein KUCAC02_033589 [Chaenocephalus aceratus]|nr:hypothetical protein KUCAC02_033589 [Chaenocephalus aceratus]
MFLSLRRFPQALFWDFKLHLIGEKDDVPVHFCDKCGLPIQLYGRMVYPCKHVFCYDCALLHEKKRREDVPRPHQCQLHRPGPAHRAVPCAARSLCSVYLGGKRTYLSQRDLQAHVNHRHMRAPKSSSGRRTPSTCPACLRSPGPFPRSFLLT